MNTDFWARQGEVGSL